MPESSRHSHTSHPVTNPQPWQVAFDATHLSQLGAGVSTFILNLLAALDATPKRNWVLSVLAKRNQIGMIGERAPGVRLIPVAVPSTAYRIVWEQTGLPRLLDRLRIDLVHSPHYSVPLTTRVARVVTIHDLSYILMPERHRRSRRWFFRHMIPRAVRAADHICCVSDWTRRDLMRLYPDIRPDKVSVVPLAVDPTLQAPVEAALVAATRAKYQLPERFVLHVGTIEPRKNVGTAIEALGILRAAHAEVELVLVGQQGWESQALFTRVRETPGVRHLGHVPSADLPTIYRAATALVMPSHYEGFGLPVLEAMALGVPVVCSGKGSLAEVAGGAALIPPDDTPAGYAAALGELISSERRREELRGRGLSQAKRFSWAAAAAVTSAIYERTLAAAGGRPEEAPSAAERGA